MQEIIINLAWWPFMLSKMAAKAQAGCILGLQHQQLCNNVYIENPADACSAVSSFETRRNTI